MIDGREIIEAAASAGADVSGGIDRWAVATARREAETARFALRLLEACPDDASVLEVREAIQDAFPGILSGGGAA